MKHELDSNRIAYWYAAIGFVGAVGLVLIPDVANTLHLPDWSKFVGYAVVSLLVGAALITVHRTAGTLDSVELQIVSYTGYDAYLNSIAPYIRRRLSISFSVQSYMGEEIFDVLHRHKAHILVFDIEHVEQLAALPDDNRLIKLEELRRYANEFPEVEDLIRVAVPQIVPRLNGEPVGFPIRLGTNAISFNRNFIGHHGSSASLYELLFGHSVLSSKLHHERRIGIWKRQSVVMGLVSLALGNKKPYLLTQEQFESLCKHLVALRKSTGRTYWGPSDYLRLRDDLNEGLIWIVLGGGEWHVDSRQSKHVSQRPNIDWSIPNEGALLWVESVGITQGCLKKLLTTSLSVEKLVELIRGHLFDLEVQHTLSVDHLYAACPISYDDLLAEKGQQYAFLGYSDPQELTQKITDGVLVFRSGPPIDDRHGWVPRHESARFWKSEWGD